MPTYLVGGAVRDALMGDSLHSDRDWVVVGSTPEAMVAQGFVPVGQDFPVFLHPQTHEEYALARTERKTAPGYHGFAFHADPSVTIEDDLARRDLTINAIAVCEAQADDPARAERIDPFGGERDLRDRCLRHITPAFAEDPVRVLRVARFAARWPHFHIATETLALMRQMVESGELDHLVAERVWQELSRALMSNQPSRAFLTLREVGALDVLLPEVARLFGVPQRAQYHPEVDTGVHLMMVLDQCARLDAPLPVRFAALCHDLGKGSTPTAQWPRHLGHEGRSVPLLRALSARWRVPKACAALAELVAREHGNIHQCLGLSAPAVLRLLERCDAFRRPERFEQALLACECDARGRLGFEDRAYPQRDALSRALQAAQTIDTGALMADLHASGRDSNGPHVGRAIAQARTEAVARVWPERGG
jgi:tRNA nucleotidyltransferase (CCA-adding enzyme)